MKKFAISVLALGLASASLTACTKKNDTPDTATPSASSVTSTASTPAASSIVTASATPVASSNTATVATPTASSQAATQPITAVTASSTTTTTTTTTAPQAAQPAAATHTPLQADLITLMGTIKHLEEESQTKQAAMDKELKTKAEKAKTPEQQAALQKSVITDVIAFKNSQKQQLSKIPLSEPRVKAARDKMVASLASDIKATQIVLSTPEPTEASKKTFNAEMKKAQDAGMQARDQIQKLMVESGMVKETATKSSKK